MTSGALWFVSLMCHSRACGSGRVPYAHGRALPRWADAGGAGLLPGLMSPAPDLLVGRSRAGSVADSVRVASLAAMTVAL